MKRKIYLTTILIIAFGLQIFAQKETLFDISKFTTCETALEISTLKQFGPTTAPPLFSLSTSKVTVFDRDLHIVWYKFTAASTGKLLFDIIPIDTLDNYDFVLYKCDNPATFCADIKANKIEPIRSNFERNDISINSRTGLSVMGDGKSYSEGIDVKKDEVYYLQLNNTYSKGKGHTIVFTYLETFTIFGDVTDAETNKPVSAEVSWINTRNDELLAQTTSDKNGKFTLKVSVSVEAHKFPDYALTVYTDKYFYADTIFPSKNLSTVKNKSFSFKIFKLQQGKNQQLGNIYFEPNEATTVVKSFIEIDRLVKLMKLNKSITVQLEGHTNGYFPSTDIDEKLSEGRAKAVRDVLINKGVSIDRIITKGLGSTQLLYPMAKDEIEEGYNRRVEIKLKF